MNDATQSPYITTADNAARIALWLRERGGIAVWESIDLGDPGFSLTTPAQTDGAPTLKPHWKVANEPARIITDPSDVLVSVDKEVKRFHVAIRTGSNLLSMKVSDGGSRRIRSAVAKAGEGAYHLFDYETQSAIIMKPDTQTPLVEWLKAQDGAA